MIIKEYLNKINVIAEIIEFTPPRKLNLTGDIRKNWKIIIEKFEIFLEENEFLEKTMMSR